MAVVAGLDLAGNPRRCSGYAEISVSERVVSNARCLYSDEEILVTIASRASVLAIDAPISSEPVMRQLDREAIRRGYRVMPPSFGGMRILTQRAWRIYSELRGLGVVVIETHPRSALKSSGAKDLWGLLERHKIEIPRSFAEALRIKDIADAMIASVVAYCYYMGTCIGSIEAPDGTLYILRKRSEGSGSQH